MGISPEGFSLQEINYALFIKNNFNIQITELFWLRLPFVILGIFSIFLQYKLVKIMFSDKLAIISALLTSILPWHVFLSRVYSPNLIFLDLFLFVLIILLNRKISLIKISKILFVFSLIIFTFSLVKFSLNSSLQVNDERLIVSYSDKSELWRFFPNKLTLGARMVLDNVYNELDFGNYLFEGQPRPRSNILEIQKLYVIFVPLILIGILNTKRNKSYALLSMFVFGLASASFLMILPIVIYTAIGIVSISKNNKLTNFVYLIIFLEAVIFLRYYFSNSLFSSKYKYFYSEVAELVVKERRQGEKVLVNDRIIGSEKIFSLYVSDLDNYEFRSFDVENEYGSGVLYVDFRPGEPSVQESLYEIPEYLTVVAEFEDYSNKEKIYVYR